MLLCLLPLAAFLLRADGRRGETVVPNNNNGHALDNDKWLSTVSQYDKDRYWNKFRDRSQMCSTVQKAVCCRRLCAAEGCVLQKAVCCRRLCAAEG
ncbi:hypothetical protein DPEC_G00025490, partial [Dallia pectoralis]